MRTMASAILLAGLTFAAGALLPAPAKAWDDGYGGGYVTYRSYGYGNDCAPRYRSYGYSRPYYRSYRSYSYDDGYYGYRRSYYPRYRTRYYDGGYRYHRPRYYTTRYYNDWYGD